MEFTDKQIDELIDAVYRNAEGIQKSAVFMQLFTGNYERDPMALIQMALAILMDKPFLIIAPEGTPINDKLRRVADDIAFFVPGDEEGLKAATVGMIKKQLEKITKH
jgi:hypothetical protein